MTFNLDCATLINFALLLAVLGFMWQLSRDVGSMEQRFTDKLDKLRTEFRTELDKLSRRIDFLSQRVSALAERIARIEGRLEGAVSTAHPPPEALSEILIASAP